jgi:hypothetical protein
MYPRTARRGQLCGGEELRDHGRDALRRARPPGNRLLLPAHPAVATTGAGDGGAHYPRSARRGQLCGGEGVPGIGKAQALPRTARSRPSCPLQLVTIKRVQKTTLHNRSSWVASTSLSCVSRTEGVLKINRGSMRGSCSRTGFLRTGGSGGAWGAGRRRRRPKE